MDTFYHRIPMLSPALRTIGTGMWEEGVDLTNPSLLDIVSGRKPLKEGDSETTIWPPDGKRGVQVMFNPSGELPKPVTGVDERKIGYPITLSFYSWAKITNVQARLLLSGNEVPCHISTPKKPSNPAAGFDMTICLMAKRFMKPQSKYQVSITCDVNGKPFRKEWSFTTK